MPDFLTRIEGSLVRKPVTQNSDFAEGQIFFISHKRDEWLPTWIKGFDKGSVQLFTFTYEKKLEVKDFLEYHGLFDYNSKVGYTLSKKGRKIIEEGGYDYVHFTGDELDEGFLVKPMLQTISILTLPLKELRNAQENPGT